MGNDESMEADDEPVEWSVLRETPLLRWFSAGTVAYIGGSLLEVVFVYPFVATPFGDPLSAVLYGVVALVGVALALYVLLPIVARSRRGADTASSSDGRDWGRRDGLLVADVVALQLLLAYMLDTTTLTINGAVAGVLFVLAVVVFSARALLEGDGEYDPEAERITFEGRTVDLATVESIQPVPLGSVTYLRLQFSEGASGPPGIAMPTGTYEQLADRLPG